MTMFLLLIALFVITTTSIAVAQYVHPDRFATTPSALARAEATLAARAARK
jgi:hypothetical protein